MRKANYLMLVAAIAAMASCAKTEVSVDPSETNSTFIGYIDDDNTKVTLVDGVKVCWVEGDEISINGKTYTATPDPDDPRKAVFTLASSTAPTGTTFRAFYPVDAYNTTAGKFYFQETQRYSTSNPLQYVNHMYAETNEIDGTLHFKNVGGLLTIDLKGEGTVSKIEVSSSDFVAGTLTDFAISESGELTYGAFDRYSYNKISLGCGTAATLSTETARRFYVSLPEGEFSDLKITVVTDKGAMTIPATKDVKIEKNNIYHLPEITVDIKPLEFDAELTIDECEATSTSTVDLTVSVKPSDKDIYYIAVVESSTYVSQFADALELAKEDIAYYASHGYSTLNSLISVGLAQKGDDLNDSSFNYCIPDKDYVLYAYAVDENLNVSEAIELPFHTPEYEMPATSAVYEDYLGTWAMGSTAIAISQKVAGESYSITGIPGQADYNVAVEAEFNQGYLFLKEQQTSTRLNISQTEYGYVFLSGIFMSSYPYYPWYGETPQTILIGEYVDGNIKVTPGTCEYASFDGFALKLLTNANKLYTVGSTVSIDNLTSPSKMPDALLGQWTCASAIEEISGVTYNNWVWTISEQGVGVAIDNFDIALPYVEGLNGTLVNTANATYEGDDKAGILTIEGGARTGLDDGYYYATWYGDDSDTDWAIFFDVDLENGTISLLNGSMDCEGMDFYTYYAAPLVFTKGAPVSAKVNVAGGNKNAGKSNVAKHALVQKNAVSDSKNSTLIFQEDSMNYKAEKFPVKGIRF